MMVSRWSPDGAATRKWPDSHTNGLPQAQKLGTRNFFGDPSFGEGLDAKTKGLESKIKVSEPKWLGLCNCIAPTSQALVGT